MFLMMVASCALCKLVFLKKILLTWQFCIYFSKKVGIFPFEDPDFPVSIVFRTALAVRLLN